MAWITAAITAGQRAKDVTASGFKEDWACVAVNAAAVGGKIAEAVFKSKMSEAFKKSTEAAAKDMGLPTPTYILDVMGVVLVCVSFLNGFWEEKGACFTTAKEQHENVKTNLLPRIAGPLDTEWRGDGADAYADMRTKLAAFVETMDGYDKEMKDLVANQAASVKEAVNCVSYSTLALIGCYAPAIALYLIPEIGPPLSYILQVVAALAVGMAVLIMELNTLDNSLDVSDKVAKLVIKYDALKTSVKNDMAGDFGDLEAELKRQQGKTVETTTVSSFTAISDGLSEFTAAPTVASLADMAGENVSPAQRALLSAAGGNGEPAVAGAKETPKVETPPAPAVTPSPQSLGQMAQTFGQVSQPVTQGVQQVSQFAQQMAQRGQSAAQSTAKPAAAAAHEGEAALEEAAPAEHALAGAAPAERAPIDAAEAAAEADRPGVPFDAASASKP